MARQTLDVWALVRKNYLVVGTFVCIILAEIAPWFGAQGGPLLPEITVKYFAVFIIFFTSGLTVKWKDLSRAVKQFQLHVFIQMFSFLYTPIFVRIFLYILDYLFELNTWICKGIIVVACMPPPVSSAVILIKSMGGNEAAAIFNSTLGSILGILLTPLLLLLYISGTPFRWLNSKILLILIDVYAIFHYQFLEIRAFVFVSDGHDVISARFRTFRKQNSSIFDLKGGVQVGISSSVPVFKTVLQLIQTMIFPVLLGQLSQKIFAEETLSRVPFSVLGQISLLYIIYTSFCDMFIQDGFNIDTHLILITIVLVIMIQVILMFSIFQVAHFISKKSYMYTAQDVITIAFCSTHKSLTLGMPLMKTLYGGYSHLSYISLPLLIYHPVQLILGGFIAPYGKKWIKKYSKTSSSCKRP